MLSSALLCLRKTFEAVFQMESLRELGDDDSDHTLLRRRSLGDSLELRCQSRVPMLSMMGMLGRYHRLSNVRGLFVPPGLQSGGL